MSQTDIIAIIGIICGAAIAVYLAYKQGIFKRTDLFVSVGAPFVDEGSERWFRKEITKSKKPLWAVCKGLHNANTDYYLIAIPFLIENRSDIAIRNIYVRLTTRLDLDCSDLNLIDYSKFNSYIFGMHRSSSTWQDKSVTEYQIPVLSPYTPLTIYEPIAIKKAMFHQEKNDFEKTILKDSNNEEILIDEIRCYACAENHKPTEFKTYSLTALSKNAKELQEKINDPLNKLYEIDCPRSHYPLKIYQFKNKKWLVWAPWPWSFWYSTLFPKCRKNKPFLWAQPSFYATKKNGRVLVEDIENTKYGPGLLKFHH